MPNKFKILSLDGGGSWAYIEALALIDLYGEDASGHDILNDFDMATANSGGSILLGGLIANMRLSDIRSLFETPDALKSIFVRASLPVTLSHHIIGVGPQYNTEAKLKGLQKILGDAGQIDMFDLQSKLNFKTQILIPACDYDTGAAVFYRSNDSSVSAGPTVSRKKVTLAEAIHASTNAPINYFDAPALVDGRRLWDGAAAGLNNPVFAAITEAKAMGVKLSDMIAASFGAHNTLLPFGHAEDDPELVQKREPASLIRGIGKMAGQIVSAAAKELYTAHIMLDGDTPCQPGQLVETGPIVRFSPMVSPVRKDGKWAVPDGLTRDEFMSLKKLDIDVTNKSDMDLLGKLTRAWLKGGVSNGLVRYGTDENDNLIPEIGNPTYAAAKRHWQSLVAASANLA